MFTDLKASLIQCVIVLIPTYTVALLTEKMVYTIPMLAASSFIASSVRKREDAVEAYRFYYIKEKVDFARWKNTETPIWFKEGVAYVPRHR